MESVRTGVTLKRDRPATGLEEIDHWTDGVGWLAHPDETMLRASHALATDAGVWLVDPVDADGVDDLVGEFGDVAGVVVLLDRHYRDADAVARRHDVPVFVPSWFEKVPEFTAPLRRFEGELPGTDYRLLKLVDRWRWQEAALHDPETATVVVPESVGTAPYYTTGEEALGVNPMLRLTPPSALRDLDAERVLVGHGRGVLDGAADALEYALAGARRRAPRLFAENLRLLLSG